MDLPFEDVNGSSMNLPTPNAGHPAVNVNSPWDLVSYPDGTSIFDSDGLDELFEGTDSELVAPIGEALPHDTGNFSTSAEQQIDPSLQDAEVFSGALTYNDPQDLTQAAVPLHQGQVATNEIQKLPPQTCSSVGLLTGPTATTADWSGQFIAKQTHNSTTFSVGQASMIGVSSISSFSNINPAAPMVVARNGYYPSQYIESSETAPLITQGESQARATQGRQHFQQPTARQGFADVNQGRIWMLRAQQGPSETSFRDGTIPRTIEQKRAVADRLRAAFEGAQPPANRGQFLLLDWTCLEMVEEVCTFHLFGPLSQRYYSGLSKHGPADFDSYDDHISALLKVIGRQDCPKARNLRKRLLDITHRKRLIDNPVAELGRVEKNEVANSARKLKNEERKRKADRAEAAELEVAKLKARLDVRSSMEASQNGSDDEWDGSHGRKPSGPPSRRFITPSRPSAKLSAAQKSTSMADDPHQVPRTRVASIGISSDHANNNTSPSSFGGEDIRRESTPIHSHGQSLPKKAECMDNQVLLASELPTQNTSATAAFGMNSLQQYQMKNLNDADVQHESPAMQQTTPISYSQHQLGDTQRLSDVALDNRSSRRAVPSMVAQDPRTTEVISPSPATTVPTTLQDARFMAHYNTIHSGLNLEQVAEAGRLGLDANEYAYRVTLEMYGLPGGLNELY